MQHFFVRVLVLHVDLSLGEVLCSKELSLTNLEQVFYQDAPSWIFSEQGSGLCAADAHRTTLAMLLPFLIM